MKNLTYLLGVLTICASLYWLYDKVNDPHAQDRKEIKENLEKGFFNLSAGSYYSNITNPEDIPFYNFDPSQYAYANTIIQFFNLMGTAWGTNKQIHYTLTPSNLVIESFSDDGEMAFISYDLTTVFSSKKTTVNHLVSDAKKIGGQWKINGAFEDQIVEKHKK